MTTAGDIEAQAAAWLVKRDGGLMTDALQVEFDAWAADPRARAAYTRLETAWRRFDSLKKLRPLDGTVDVDILSRSPFAPVPIDEYAATEETRAAATEDFADATSWDSMASGDSMASDDSMTACDPMALGDSLTSRDPASSSDPTSSSAPSACEPTSSGAAASDTTSSEAPTEARPRRRHWLLGFAIAATLAALALGALLWQSHQQSDWRTYVTEFGGLSRIVLEDGSVINLNTNSEMRVRLSADMRRVVLMRGEALFKVAHDPARPFYVQANGTMVRAVGTEFSVRVREARETRRGQDVEVLVKEGRVAIDTSETGSASVQRPESSSAPTAMLAAGEAAVIDDAQAVAVQKVAVTEVERKLSWTEGRLWFERQTLKDVVAEFNRYNRRQIVIADPSIENLRIGGGFEATDPDSFIAALEPTLGVRGVLTPASADADEVIRLIKAGNPAP